MLLSIIIPAYNVEKYIAECLESCLSQIGESRPSGNGRSVLDESDVEIIVVDDGSTDSTPDILADYAAKHSCIRLFHQKNQGQSVARNLAIEAAQGDYIYMVDSDDQMLKPETEEESVLPISLMREARFDIIGLQVWYQPEFGERRPWSHQMEHWPFGQEYSSAADFVTGHNIEGLVYGYVFRRQIFVDHPQLRFTPGIYHQDEELIFKIFTLAGRTIYQRGYSYLYFEHTGSSINTRTAQRKRKLMDDYLVILHNLTAWRDRFGTSDERTTRLHCVMHYKLSYLAMDMLRKLIRDNYDHDYILMFIHEMQSMNLYPLPYIREWKYLIMKMLTFHPALVSWWAKHQALNRKIGF